MDKRPWLFVPLLLGCMSFELHAQTVAPTDMIASKPDFAFPDGPIRIILLKPDIEVSELTTGGVEAPNADWTAKARENLIGALGPGQLGGDATVRPMPDLVGDDNRTMVDYRLLLKAVVRSVVTHRQASDDRLPAKDGKFDWTLGPGARRLGEMGGGDYGLFLSSQDSFKSADGQAARAVGALLGAEEQAEKHTGYAGLVDLATGDLVWLAVESSMRGDIRSAEGARRRMTQLLRTFPKRATPVVPTKP